MEDYYLDDIYSFVQTLTIFTIIAGIIITLSILVINWNVGTMKRKIIKMEQYLNGFAKEHGYGQNYRCTNCKKIYEGKQEKCPNCGMEKDYS
jgi:hypothetical protein